MLQFGKNITQSGDPLQKVSIERLYKGISQPKQSFKDLVQQLRMVRSMDERQYKQLKKSLPYFVCGNFHPAIRRKEHFASISYFILDLDHLETANLSVDALAKDLQQEEEVVLLFTSPSADGLKVMFRLKEPCVDLALFSSFYKLFAHRFAQKHGLGQVIDHRTSDATRACFMSYDPCAYFNPDAHPIDLQAFLPDLNFDAVEQDIKKIDKGISQQQKQQRKEELPKDTLSKIKKKLNPNYKQRRKKEHYVPPQIDEAIPILNEQLADYDMQLLEATPISYGRKVKVACDKRWAEINVFYGKRGFTVVQTTKSGSNAELAALAAQVFKQILEI